MILMDYSQVILATLFVSIGNHTNIELTEDLMRHMFLSSIRHNVKKFKNDYGNLVICCDSNHSWRKDIFPYYKANRRKNREKSEIDWDLLFSIIENIKNELDEFFPYKVIKIDGAEADDIIGTISAEYGVHLNNGSERVLILSGDKDYIQMQRFANVEQYDPVGKKFIRNDDPETFTIEHVMRGDTGDGIPNILSPDNCLVIGERQKPMTKNRLALFKESVDNMDQQTKDRYERNKKLIDLSYTPEDLKQKIMDKFNEEKTIGKSKMMKFFMDKKLKLLMPNIQDF